VVFTFFVVVCRRAHVVFTFFVFVCRRAHVLFTFFVVLLQTTTKNVNTT
jgi:hypothetical protein